MAGKYLAKKPRKNRKKIVIGVLFLCFAALAVFSAWKLFSAQREYDVGTEVYTALEQNAVIRQEPQAEPEAEEKPTVFIPTQTEQAQPDAPVPEETPQEQSLVVDFAMLEDINPEVVAWISSEDGISYPVVQGTDNEYYLTHLVDGTVNSNGSIFVDYRNTPGFVDRNTFIYGHNMLNGAMFASLANYSSQSYYEKYPELLLITPEQTYSLQVFAGYVTPGDSDSYQISFEDDEAFEAYLRKIRSRSYFTSDVAVTVQDQIVTLSTCTYDYEEARYVLHCRLVPLARP